MQELSGFCQVYEKEMGSMNQKDTLELLKWRTNVLFILCCFSVILLIIMVVNIETVYNGHWQDTNCVNETENITVNGHYTIACNSFNGCEISPCMIFTIEWETKKLELNYTLSKYYVDCEFSATNMIGRQICDQVWVKNK